MLALGMADQLPHEVVGSDFAKDETGQLEDEGRMSFKSYNRFFPNQDFIPEDGFGNLVALPLQGQARRDDNSIFVDDNFNAYADQDMAELPRPARHPLLPNRPQNLHQPHQP